MAPKARAPLCAVGPATSTLQCSPSPHTLFGQSQEMFRRHQAGFVRCFTEAWGESQLPPSHPSITTQVRTKSEQLGEPGHGRAFPQRALRGPRGAHGPSGPGSFPAAPGAAPLAPPGAEPGSAEAGGAAAPGTHRSEPLMAVLERTRNARQNMAGAPLPLRPRQPPWRRPAAQRRPAGNRLPARPGPALGGV